MTAKLPQETNFDWGDDDWFYFNDVWRKRKHVYHTAPFGREWEPKQKMIHDTEERNHWVSQNRGGQWHADEAEEAEDHINVFGYSVYFLDMPRPTVEEIVDPKNDDEKKMEVEARKKQKATKFRYQWVCSNKEVYSELPMLTEDIIKSIDSPFSMIQQAMAQQRNLTWNTGFSARNLTVLMRTALQYNVNLSPVYPLFAWYLRAQRLEINEAKKNFPNPEKFPTYFSNFSKGCTMSYEEPWPICAEWRSSMSPQRYWAVAEAIDDGQCSIYKNMQAAELAVVQIEQLGASNRIMRDFGYELAAIAKLIKETKDDKAAAVAIARKLDKYKSYFEQCEDKDLEDWQLFPRDPNLPVNTLLDFNLNLDPQRTEEITFTSYDPYMTSDPRGESAEFQKNMMKHHQHMIRAFERKYFLHKGDKRKNEADHWELIPPANKEDLLDQKEIFEDDIVCFPIAVISAQTKFVQLAVQDPTQYVVTKDWKDYELYPEELKRNNYIPYAKSIVDTIEEGNDLVAPLRWFRKYYDGLTPQEAEKMNRLLEDTQYFVEDSVKYDFVVHDISSNDPIPMNPNIKDSEDLSLFLENKRDWEMVQKSPQHQRKSQMEKPKMNKSQMEKPEMGGDDSKIDLD